MKKSTVSSMMTCLGLTFIMVFYQNCGGSLDGQDERSASSTTISDTTNTVVSEKVGRTVGVTSFEATYTNMKVITGVDDGSCDNEFEDGKNSLPSTNDITTFGSAGQGAAVKIAACLCRRAITNNVNGGRDRLAPGANLNNNPVSAGDKDIIIDGIMRAAWGENNANIAPESRQILMETIDGLDANGNSAREAAFGICSTALASLGTSLL